jgi:hypothetical protein
LIFGVFEILFASDVAVSEARVIVSIANVAVSKADVVTPIK